ncbi:ATP-binding protein [Massilia sp. W12]|uniref:ATP-binding protein n=1 Tax=Massilia sp. W12 TaxID=3126507 RepID=UPI0030D288ED
MIAFFETNAKLTALQSRAQLDVADAADLVALAWYMRQSAQAQAQVLAQRALLRLDRSPAHQLLRLRLDLLRAERHWLCSEHQAALALAQACLEQAGALSSQAALQHSAHALCCDAHELLSWLVFELGDVKARHHHLQQALRCAQQAEDALRNEYLQASILAALGLYEPAAAEAQLQAWLPHLAGLHPVSRAAFHNALGLQMHMSENMAEAIGHYMQACQDAQQCGQSRRAIVCAGNVSRVLLNLNDVHAALEWIEKAIDIARQTQWRSLYHDSMTQYASCLRQLGRFSEGLELVQETMQALQSNPHSHRYSQCLQMMGELQSDLGQHADALQSFSKLQEQAARRGYHNFQAAALSGQAKSLLGLARFDAARQCAEEGLRFAQEMRDPLGQVELLEVLAHIHAANQDAGRQRACLLQALEIADSIHGMQTSSSLLDSLADLHAAQGDFLQANTYSQHAGRVREDKLRQDTLQRLQSLQTRHHAERMQIEAEQLQQQAQAEALRVQALAETGDTLSHLSAVGREITACRDLAGLFASMENHVRNLLQADYCALLVMDAEGSALHSVFRIQGQTHLPPYRVSMDNPSAFAVQCVREQRELVLFLPPDDRHINRLADVDITQSALFAPLIAGGRVLGVMTIQSFAAHAYNERELLVFRNLCAYGAIALDNAQAWQQVQENQRQLVAQEKLAALGGLVDGVAQALLDPLTHCQQEIRALHQARTELSQAFAARTLQAADLGQFIQQGLQQTRQAGEDLTRAAQLVTQFKQLAVQRAQLQAQEFDLAQVSQAAAAIVLADFEQHAHRLELAIAPGIVLHSFAGPYAQVLRILLENALQHAFAARRGGLLRISAQLRGARVEIRCEDDGGGMPPQTMAQIFNHSGPEHSRRPGLGLHIAYNIVTALLEGKINCCVGTLGGCCFMLDLPLRAGDGA